MRWDVVLILYRHKLICPICLLLWQWIETSAKILSELCHPFKSHIFYLKGDNSVAVMGLADHLYLNISCIEEIF